MESDYRESPESLEHLLETTLDPVYPSSQSPASSEIQYCSQHLISEICDIDHPIYWLTDDLKNDDSNYLGCQQHLINSSLALSPISNPKSPGTDNSNLAEHDKELSNIEDGDLYKSSDIDDLDLEAYLCSLTESQEKDFAKYAQDTLTQDNLTPPYSHSDVNNNQIFFNDQILRNDNESLSFDEPFCFIYQPLSPSLDYSISGQENEVTCESFQIKNDDFNFKLPSQNVLDLYDHMELEQINNKSITELSTMHNETYLNNSDTFVENPKLFSLKSENKDFTTDNITSCKNDKHMDVSYVDYKQSLKNWDHIEHKICAKRKWKSNLADFGTKKKVQNKEAARRYRDKKKARQKSICEEEDDLRKKNKILKSEVERLTHETNALRRLAYECLGKKGLIERGIKL